MTITADSEAGVVVCAVAEATSYVVHRAASADGPFAPLTTLAAISTIDAQVMNGTTYFYAVSAINVGGSSELSSAVSAVPFAPPGAPSGLAATAGNAQVSLAWTASPRAVGYSIRRALLEMGPDGFPFEKLVSRLFQIWGYETLTDQTCLGTCVAHEVDVVAWKDDELSMVEAKFHNEFGLKSDLKVALYVKARYDDLAKTVFDYGGKKRILSSEGHWLVTNTNLATHGLAGTCQE